jgi:hypothetical protein
MSTLLLTLAIPWRPVPYKRAPHAARWRKDVKAYHDSQNAIASWLYAAASEVPWQKAPFEPRPGFSMVPEAARASLRRRLLPIRDPVRVGVAVWVPPVKSGANKGELPMNIGDWDNYFKGLVDCFVTHGALLGDHARAVIGPAGVVVPTSWGVGGMVESGIYLRPSGDRMPKGGACVVSIWAAEKSTGDEINTCG